MGVGNCVGFGNSGKALGFYSKGNGKPPGVF